tara:strand:- start:1054 stop:1239 length:186 start_codon:yes stop_codon:yes gene_type:complete
MHTIDENIAGTGLNLFNNIAYSNVVIINVIKNPNNLNAKNESPNIKIKFDIIIGYSGVKYK